MEGRANAWLSYASTDPVLSGRNIRRKVVQYISRMNIAVVIEHRAHVSPKSTLAQKTCDKRV